MRLRRKGMIPYWRSFVVTQSSKTKALSGSLPEKQTGLE